jgi:hypothetical protein
VSEPEAPPASAESSASPAEHFYGGATRRILRFLLFLTPLATAIVAWRLGWAYAGGFLAGAVVAWLNFRWLARGVEGLAERIVAAHSRERGFAVVGSFVLRYLLVGGVAYAIFYGSSQAFRGFLIGLCLPVAAMLCEAAYEAQAAIRRGY